MPTVRLVKHDLRRVVVGTRTISIILPVLSSSARLNTFLSHCVIGEKQPQVDMVVYGYESFRIRKGKFKMQCNAKRKARVSYDMHTKNDAQASGK